MVFVALLMHISKIYCGIAIASFETTRVNDKSCGLFTLQLHVTKQTDLFWFFAVIFKYYSSMVPSQFHTYVKYATSYTIHCTHN